MSSEKLELEKLLLTASERNASDLHLTVGRQPTLRIDRELVTLTDESILDSERTRGLIMVMLNDEQKKILEREKEIDFSYSYKHRIRFRVNVFHQKGFLGAALRLIPNRIKTLKELGLPPLLEQFTKINQGFVLVVGPTGHGKTTTVASLINIINNSRAEHIITIEDPIEYLFEPDKSIIDQRELHRDTRSFAKALKSALREDPNVVMVGEMRDLETIAAAITVAETGHLVFSTLHTNNAAQTIDRIIDVFPPHQQNQIRLQLAETISGVVSQRLLPKIGGGRVVVTEIMTATSAVRNLIREGKTHQLNTVIQTGAEFGMMTLDNSLAELVRKGVIEENVALGWANDRRYLEELLREQY